MSNIHNLEPQAFGLIIIKTTFGNIEIELFTKQCPKATRNFIQLCLDGYYEETIFERVEKDFIAVGGALKDKNKGIYDESFPDEFHSRLRFIRRGLLATANTVKNDNGPKFFFTLGSTPELQNKHTIFGRVKGNSIYSLVELNECQVDKDFRPYIEQKITQAAVIENPMIDLVPRLLRVPGDISEAEDSSSDSDDPLLRPKPDPKEYKKLSFFHDEDEEDIEVKREKNSGNVEQKADKQQQLDFKPDFEEKISCSPEAHNEESVDDAKIENGQRPSLVKCEEDSIDPKERRLREIRAQIQDIKQQIEKESKTKARSERRQDESSSDRNIQISTAEQSQLRITTNKGKKRERETIELITNFKRKLKEASNKTRTSEKFDEEETELGELAYLDRVDGDEWLKHKFEGT